MPAHGDTVGADGVSQSRAEPQTVLGRRLEASEVVVHEIESGSAITHETPKGGSESIETGGAGTATLAITDRRVLLGTETNAVEIPFRDVREVSVASGLIRSRIDLRVWNRGEFCISPSRGQDLEAAGEFLETAATVRQRVLAALEDAREHITDLGNAIEAGERGAIETARDDITHDLSLSARRIDDAPEVCREGLEDLVREAETELQRTRVHANLARGQALADEADARTGVEDWLGAERALCTAREHFETALSAAVERDFGLVGSIQRELDSVDDQATAMAERQRTLLAEAAEAARAADGPETAAPAWAAALKHARAAARFDWGGRLGADRDAVARRRDVELTAARLIQARREHAARLRGDGELAALTGDLDGAAVRYEAAANQLRAAARVARELQAADADRLAERAEGCGAQKAVLRSLADVADRTTDLA